MSLSPGIPAPSRRPLRAERALREGYRAWLEGELDRAVAALEAASLASPGSPDPLLYLSRALSEKNDRDRALSVIDESIALDPSGASGRLYRAIILLDHGDPGAASALSSSKSSHLGAALLVLAGEGTADGSPLSLPAPARWIPDAAGRLLSLLEARLLARGEDWIDIHHAVFSGGPEASAPERPAEAAHAKPSTPKDATSCSAKEYWSALESAFARKDYRTIIGLHADGGAKESWQDLHSSAYRIFAHIACGEERAALELLQALRPGHPSSADLHFLEGLAHARAGRPRESAWSFARAARFADMEVDEVIRSVSAKAGQPIQWVRGEG
jgi:hypothetical protein